MAALDVTERDASVASALVALEGEGPSGVDAAWDLLELWWNNEDAATDQVAWWPVR